MKNSMSRDTKICIIGAGPAGLSVAHFLNQKEYKNIKIIEKNDTAGGKCCSINYEDRSYELGAVLGDSGYRTTMSIVKKTVSSRSMPPKGYLSDFNGGAKSLQKRCWELPLMLEALFRYIPVKIFNRRLRKPGFDYFDSQFHDTFYEWTRRNNFSQIYNAFEPIFAGFGYDYFEDIPAAYVVKFFTWSVMFSGLFFNQRVFVWKDGIQDMWRRVAKDFDVHYSTEIKQIKRGEKVELETLKEKFESDILILACPLDNTMAFLDVTSDEREFFSKIRYIDYQTYLCFVDGLPEANRHDYIMPNITDRRKGHMIVWYKRWADSNLVTVYVISDWEKSDNAIINAIETDLKRLGAKLKGVHSFKKWNYFPHVSTEDFKNGFYENLEGLQGNNNTYYIGELLSFPSVEHVTRYSKYLVERFF